MKCFKKVKPAYITKCAPVAMKQWWNCAGNLNQLEALLVLRVEILQSLFQRKKFLTSLENVTGFMSLCSVSLLKQ